MEIVTALTKQQESRSGAVCNGVAKVTSRHNKGVCSCNARHVGNGKERRKHDIKSKVCHVRLPADQTQSLTLHFSRQYAKKSFVWVNLALERLSSR